MASSTWTLVRVQVGETPGNLGLTCIDPAVPLTCTLRGVQDGEVETVSVCADVTLTPCAAGGLADVLKDNGHTLADNPCT